MFPSFFEFRSFWNKKSQNDILKTQANKITNTVMSVKKCDQQKNLVLSDWFTLQNLYKFYYFM